MTGCYMKKGNKKDSKTIQVGDLIISKRPAIQSSEKIKLWVRSGGRCAICKKYLLDLNYDANIGEIAHIVGWIDTKNSPRGKSDLPLKARNCADNLILLCAEHHKIVDTKEALLEFTVERLMLHKKEHESRIHHLTGLHTDSDSVVIRMMGKIRGGSVEVSQENAREVIYQSDKRTARFIDSFDKQSWEIDLSRLSDPEESWEEYWSLGKTIIDNEIRIIEQGINKGNIRHLSVFALARIPLLIYLGYKLDDKTPTSIYQKHRGENESWMWSDIADEVSFKVTTVKTSAYSNVTLILNLSGSIDLSKLPLDISSDVNTYIIEPSNSIPNRDILRNRKSYENFVQTYHNFLSQIEIKHKSCSTIHLFPAVPISAAIACGRGVMKDAHPSITIYDLTGETYLPTITINSNETN